MRDATLGADPATAMDPAAWARYLSTTANDLRSAWSHARATELFRAARGAPAYVPGFRRARVGILRNATVEPWLPAMFAALARRGIFAELWVGDYEVYEAYASSRALGPAGQGVEHLVVYFEPGALAGDARLLPPPDLSDALHARIDGVVQGLLDRWGGHVILANLAPDAREYTWPHGQQDPGSWLNQRRALNSRLLSGFAGEPRVSLLDLDELVSRYGATRARDERLYATARVPFAVDFLPVLGEGIARVVAAAAGERRKCVVVDCDNTLWGGILGEDGPEGVLLGPEYPGSAYREFQLFLKALSERGFLLAIASKNNEADVLEFITRSPDMVLGVDDFVAHRIDWEDKASNLRALAAELDLGLDSMIFVDDSDVECELVATLLPEVQVERFPTDPLAIPAFIESLPGTERLVVTEEDRKRSASYRATRARERLREEAPDLSSFIRDLDIRIIITRQDRGAIQRISQLTQRTNQFNLTVRRYGVDEVERRFDDGVVYTMRMVDRFTDYGVIGLAIVRNEEDGVSEIDTFLLSCRAFGRRVEGVLLRTVIEDCQGAKALRGRYRPTDRNGMVRDFYSEHGFAVTADGQDERVFLLDPPRVVDSSEDALYSIEKVGF